MVMEMISNIVKTVNFDILIDFNYEFFDMMYI